MRRLFIFILFMVSSHLLSAKQQPINNDLLISQDEIRLVINNIIFELQNTYLYPERTKHLSQKLLAKLNTGGFQNVYYRQQFRLAIRAALVKETSDTGFDIVEHEPLIIANYSGNITEVKNIAKTAIAVEVLDNNIGLLKLTGDLTFSDAQQIMQDAFTLLADVDAMIIDLRLADAVPMSLVQQLVSYFIASDTLIGNVEFNHHESKLFALKTPGYEQFKEKFPLYILNSSFITGEWEFFAYTLKHFDKAVIVGENTMGLSYFTKTVNVSENLLLRIPYAKIKHPVSNEAWSDDGVIADFYAQGDAMIEKAYELALTRLLAP